MFAMVASAHPMVSMSEPVRVNSAAAGLCKPCIGLSEQGLNILLNYVLNVGVVGGCSKVCSALKGQGAVTICNIACDLVGIKEFVKILENSDLDPFYFCEELTLCPKGKDDAAGKIVDIVPTPPSGPASTVFQLNLDFQVVNETGVGEIRLGVKGPGSIDIGQGFPNTGFTPGTYRTTVSLDTSPQESADPPVEFLPGVYSLDFAVCQGECGSKHPGSIKLDEKLGNFTITQ